MTNINNGLTAKQNVIGLTLIGTIALIAIFFITATPAKAEPKALSSEEKVAASQITYDKTQSDAKETIIKACQAWKDHALNKIELANKAKIEIDLNADVINAVDCKEKAKIVPVSFL